MTWISSLAMSSTTAGYSPVDHRLLDTRTHEPAAPVPQAEVATAVLDALAVAIVVVDRSCRILHSNASARLLLQSTTAFVRSRDRLLAARKPLSDELAASVARIARSDAAGSEGTSDQIAAAAASGLDITVLRLAWPQAPICCAKDASSPDGPCAAILIRELEARHTTPSKAFIERHKITGAEARVLARLMAGDSLQVAAIALGVSTATIKTHLQHLFAKTQTKRQAELVLLAMTSTVPPAMW